MSTPAGSERANEQDWGPQNEPGFDEDAARFERAADFARRVEARAFDLRILEAAKDKVTAERTAQVAVPPFDAAMLSEILARPAEPPHRVEDLIPTDSATLIVAQRKTGKTTFDFNLANSLLRGHDFLGRFGVRKLDGDVGYLNFEVTAGQAARWADEVGVPRDRLFIVNLRGRRNPFKHSEDRELLAEELRAHSVETLMLDPFGRAYTGLSQNDPGEVGAWLADLDRFARGDAGVTDLVLAAHAGWDGERTRGSSALEDWADSIITLVRDRNDDHVRYMRAEGRDVLVDEDRLDYDPVTRTLTLAGSGSRKTATKLRGIEELITVVVEEVQADPGANGTDIEKRLREHGVVFQRGDERKALRSAVERALLVVQPGKGNAKNYFPKSSLPELPQASPMGMPESYPNPTLIGGVALQTNQTQEPPQELDRAPTDGTCRFCAFPLAAALVEAGETSHPTCEEKSA